MFSINDIYPQYGQTTTTTEKTIPETEENQHYHEEVASTGVGKKVSRKNIFISVGVILLILFALKIL